MINLDLKTKEGIRNWLWLFFKSRKTIKDIVPTGTLDIKYNPYPQYNYIGRYVSSDDNPNWVVDCYGILSTDPPLIRYCTRRLDPKYQRTQEITVLRFRQGGRDIFGHSVRNLWRYADYDWWDEGEEGDYPFRPKMYDEDTWYWYYCIIMTYEDWEDESTNNKNKKHKKISYEEFLKKVGVYGKAK